MMSIGFLYYLLLIIWAIFGVCTNWPVSGRWAGGQILFLVLFVIIGWKIFGAPFHS